MSVDKLVDSAQLDSDLTSVANAIRAAGGTSAQLAFPAGFVGAIGNLISVDVLRMLIDGSITSLEIPDGVTSIVGYGLMNRGYLQSVRMPTGVTRIGTYAFRNCVALTNIDLPEGITNIDSNAFAICTSLPSIEIPASVTAIGALAFDGCTSLLRIRFKASSPPTVANANAWRSLPVACVIQVPYSADHAILNAYKAASNYPIPSSYTYEEYTE